MRSSCVFCGGLIKKYLRVNEGWIYVCRNCEIGVSIPKPPAVPYSNDDFHEQFNVNNIDELPRQWRNSILKQCNLIENNFDKNIKILEIGCGQGLMLKELQNRGYNVIGLEPSVEASKIARNKKLNVVTGYFPETKVEEKFDLIIISHVLEHIEDYKKFIESLEKVIKSNGCLLLTQTNYKGLIPRIQKDSWYAWVPEQHFWHFTPNGLAFIFNKFGYKKIKLIRSSLVHGLTPITFIAELFPILGDQFHLLAKYEK